jgi:hypothetical protein
MNSLPDNRLEETLDQLLAASVSPGSEPEGFYIGLMPRRPVFPWMQLIYALTGVSIFGFFFMDWLFSRNIAEIDYAYLFSLDGITALFSGVSTGTLTTLMGLAAAAVLILPEKLKLLSRAVLSS